MCSNRTSEQGQFFDPCPGVQFLAPAFLFSDANYLACARTALSPHTLISTHWRRGVRYPRELDRPRSWLVSSNLMLLYRFFRAPPTRHVRFRRFFVVSFRFVLFLSGPARPGRR